MPTTFPMTAASATDLGFTVVLLRQNLRLDVGPGECISDVLQLAGVHVDTLCEQGVCGTCVMPWTAGQPVHHDSCLSAEERLTHVALCCARNGNDTLTLDL